MRRRFLPPALVMLVLSLTIPHLQAQKFSQTVRGRVLDHTLEQPLPGANVYMTVNGHERIGTITGENGFFSLENIPAGRQNIHVSFVGYQEKTLLNILVSTGKEPYLEIYLKEKLTELDEVKVYSYGRKDRAINEMATVSARQFSMEETERYAGSMGDPSRMARNFAGVVAAGDQRNDIIIRGNSPTGLLWKLDGVPIPNPNHWGASGSTGGPVSMLNNNLLLNSDFFTGAFPAEYGNAYAGVFDLNMRSGNKSEREYVGQIGYNGFEFGLEGPFSKENKASYLANYRYSAPAIFKYLGISDVDGAIPYYQDLSFKVDLPTEKAGRFSLTGLGGMSDIEFKQENENQGTYNNTPQVNTRNGSDMGTVFLNHLIFPSEKSRFKSFLAWSASRIQTSIDSVNNKTGDKQTFYEENNTEIRLTGGTEYRIKKNQSNTFELGTYISVIDPDYHDKYYDKAMDTLVSSTKPGNQKPLLIHGYSQWKHQISSALSLTTGLHYQHFTLNNSKSLEPRAGISFDLNQSNQFTLGYGLHSQLQPILIYFTVDKNGKYTNKDLDFTRSHHFVLGHNISFSKNMRLKTEIYYQDLYHIPVEDDTSVYSVLNEGASFHLNRVNNLVNEGKGKNYGIEFTLERFFANNYYFLITTSIFQSKYSTLYDFELNSAFNNNFITNLLTGYEWRFSEKLSLTTDARMVIGGGKRLRGIDLEASIADESGEYYDNQKAYAKKAPDYFRADLRIGLKNNLENFSQEWALDIRNITDHKNVFSQYYDNYDKAIYYNYQLGLELMFLYRIHF
jgi:hypothetical protein